MMKCEFCQNHEQGDTLYESSDWDGGIGFDYIRNIKYCPLCGRMLNAEDEQEYNEKWQMDSVIPKNALRSDCNGCRFVGAYDTEFPCANCVRKNKDYYDSK